MNNQHGLYGAGQGPTRVTEERFECCYKHWKGDKTTTSTTRVQRKHFFKIRKVAANLLPGSAGEKTADGSNGDIDDCVQDVTNEAAGRGFSVALTITLMALL